MTENYSTQNTLDMLAKMLADPSNVTDDATDTTPNVDGKRPQGLGRPSLGKREPISGPLQQISYAMGMFNPKLDKGNVPKKVDLDAEGFVTKLQANWDRLVPFKLRGEQLATDAPYKARGNTTLEPMTNADASPLLSGTGVSSNDMPPLTPAEQAGVDVALEAQGNGLMSRPASDAAPIATESPATTADTTTTANSFYQDIGEHAETDHGSTPIATADASESHLAAAARSKDVGYGHKIARGGAEDTSGIIHGIQFKNADGTYIPLTNAQKSTILEADMAANLNIARTADVGGWDTKLAEINTTWDALDSKYQNALTSLAFNVGGTKAADKWTAVLKKAKDKDITGFATDMRRKDNDQYTAGMDNRVAKELYYSGIISNLSEVATQLPLASASTSGIPE
jgi:hypothetical protein